MLTLTRIPRRLLAGAALLAACREAPAAKATVSGDPLQLTFAPSLNVKLDSTELRPSGLYVHDLVVGTGAVADSMSTAEVHYEGWLADGTPWEFPRQGIHYPLAPIGLKAKSKKSRQSLIFACVFAFA